MVAWVLWIFLGGIGGHRYYLGDIGYGIAMTLFTWMTFGLWWLVDAFSSTAVSASATAKSMQKSLTATASVIPPGSHPVTETTLNCTKYPIPDTESSC